ncbi:hypothetical protein BDW42DRAFT_37826 [Aspergillus taichungensis]|uniref:Uncharacterized protein n=1 Tax=Aspergillus taichungensis TaxID=482145 RepID=A0A2J5HFE0_9EURO|nr:hypothetical protein BDW42DRAFT_37826 [Aspergillus taichungensis]
MMLMVMLIAKRETDNKDTVLALPLLALPPRPAGDVTVCRKETRNPGIAKTPPSFFLFIQIRYNRAGLPQLTALPVAPVKMRRPRVETGHQVIHALFSRSRQKLKEGKKKVRRQFIAIKPLDSPSVPSESISHSSPLICFPSFFFSGPFTSGSKLRPGICCLSPHPCSPWRRIPVPSSRQWKFKYHG